MNDATNTLKKNTNVAVVMGSYVNAYNIVRELSDNSVENIVLLDDQRKFTNFSKLIQNKYRFHGDCDSLLLEINKIKREYEFLVFFPTSDEHLILLESIYHQIEKFSYIPFNKSSIQQLLSKEKQYEICHELNLPYPEYKVLTSAKQIKHLENFSYPMLVKPTKSIDAFRNQIFYSFKEVNEKYFVLSNLLDQDVDIICSQIISGDDSSIYAYTACVSSDGRIINYWTGRKLSQHPDNFGVFSSAVACDNVEVKRLAEAIISKMGVHGIVEPEFKYDAVSGKYFLMEVNLRSMMWHRVGALSGINLHYNQWQLSLNEDPKIDAQNFENPTILIYMKHEISNIFCRPGYLRKFIFSRLTSNEKWSFAVYNTVDPIPALVDFLDLPKLVLKRWLKAFINTFSKK